MKTTIVALCGLMGVVVSLAAGIAGGGRAATPSPAMQIGVVSVLEILQQDRRHGEEVLADQRKAEAELSALAKEATSAENDLATLKTNSLDYLQQAQTVAEARARFTARREFLQRQMALKAQQWTQKRYSEIAHATREVATEKGLSLVLVKDDPNQVQTEAVSALLATQKVLYSDGCPDITQDVLARLSAANP
jgi:Skp family chaperone for outer membrane proteins